VEGGICLLEALELLKVLKVLEVMRFVQLCLFEVSEVIRCVLSV